MDTLEKLASSSSMGHCPRGSRSTHFWKCRLVSSGKGSTFERRRAHFTNRLMADGSDGRGVLFMAGLTESITPLSNACCKNRDATMGRARYNLTEVFEQLVGCDYAIQTHQALNCDAAPVGWSKYLAEGVGVDKIYSGDPTAGALDSSVAHLHAAHHLPLRIEAASLVTAFGSQKSSGGHLISE